MSRHGGSRRRAYAKRQHEQRERPKRWQAVLRQWETEQESNASFGRLDDDWSQADFGQAQP